MSDRSNGERSRGGGSRKPRARDAQRVVRIDPDAFAEPDDPEVSVWRYLDLAKAIDLLRRRELYLPCIGALGDPYEGSFTQSVIEGWSRDDPGLAAALKRERDRLRRTVYASCWHANANESDAMWVRYGGNAEGLALRTSYAALRDSVLAWGDGTAIGLVRYVDHERDGAPRQQQRTVQGHDAPHGRGAPHPQRSPHPRNLLEPMMQKRKAFEHEREVRVLHVDDAARARVDEAPHGVYLPWDAERVLRGVYLNPLAPDWYYEVVQSVLEHYAPALARVLCWSRIRVEPYR